MRLRFALALPIAAVLTTLFVESPFRRSALTAEIWYTVNAPAKFFELVGWPITNVFGSNFGLNLDRVFLGIGVLLLWFAIGSAIDSRSFVIATHVSQWHDETSNRALLYTGRMLTFLVLALVEFMLLRAMFSRIEVGTLLLKRNNRDAFATLGNLTCGAVLMAWSILFLLGGLRYFHNCVDWMERAIRSRPWSPWKAYMAPAIVLPLLITIDGRVLSLTILFVVSIVQLKYRSLAGWVVLLVWFFHYSLLAVVNMAQSRSDYTSQFFFLACGLVPLVSLLLWHPRFHEVN